MVEHHCLAHGGAWSARVWTFWFFLVPWLPLGLGDFLVVLLGWSSVLGLRIVGGLTL